MTSLINLFFELINLLTPFNIFLLLASSMGGIIIGALPGLTATMGIALLTGLTFGLQLQHALIILMGIYVGGIYGGSISAVLIGIPGTGSAAATVLDGHSLAKQGHGTKVLSVATLASFIGTVFGMICLAGFTPLLEKLALKFTSPEFALLAIFGVTICGTLTAGSTALKGWIAGLVGLIFSTIGYETMYAYPRFSYGNVSLMGGIAFVPAMIGLFGIPSILNELSLTGIQTIVNVSKEKGIGIIKIVKENFPLILRSGLIGTGVGAIPGVGEDVAAWLSYDIAKKTSKTPEQFGRGTFEGVIAPETANNAAIGGAIIPLLSLAVPGSAPAAVLLGAFQLHGIRPGPMLSVESPLFLSHLSAILLLAAVCMRVCAIPACRFAPKILKVPKHILMPVVGVLCCIGAYALTINKFDLYVMFFFGLIGFACEKMRYPTAPIVLGIILGPLVDDNLRRMLKSTGGSLELFVTRPIALIILLVILFTILGQFGVVRKIKNVIFKRPAKENH
jgi:putative tricarboxylic transport membrane protein